MSWQGIYREARSLGVEHTVATDMAEETTIPQVPNCDAGTNTERSEQQTPGGQRRRERTNSPLQGYKMEEVRLPDSRASSSSPTQDLPSPSLAQTPSRSTPILSKFSFPSSFPKSISFCITLFSDQIQKVVELTKSVRRQNSGRGPTQKKSQIRVFYYRRSTTMTREPEEDENVPEGSSSSS